MRNTYDLAETYDVKKFDNNIFECSTLKNPQWKYLSKTSAGIGLTFVCDVSSLPYLRRRKVKLAFQEPIPSPQPFHGSSYFIVLHRPDSIQSTDYIATEI